MSGSVQVYLSALDENVTPTTDLTWDAAAEQITGIDAIATVYVKTSEMKDIFWFGTDSIDVSDGDISLKSDLSFYLNFPNHTDSPLFSTSAFAGMITSGMVGGLSSLNGHNLVPNELQVPQDYARYVASTLFGIYNAVDLFNNESTFAESLYSLSDTDINNKHNKLMKAVDINNASSHVATYSSIDAVDPSGAWVGKGGHQYVTNGWVNSKNLGFQILKQLEKGDPMRFTTDLKAAGNLVKETIDPGHAVYRMPFKDGDSISFKVTVKPHSSQVPSLLNGDTSISLSDRVYQIRYLLVSDTEYAKTASVSNNAHANNVIDTTRYVSSHITPITTYASVTADNL